MNELLLFTGILFASIGYVHGEAVKARVIAFNQWAIGGQAFELFVYAASYGAVVGLFGYALEAL